MYSGLLITAELLILIVLFDMNIRNSSKKESSKQNHHTRIIINLMVIIYINTKLLSRVNFENLIKKDRRENMLKCNLRKLMAERKIDDISDLMRLSGVSRNSINKLYREKDIETIKIETLIKLCNALKCNLSDIIEYLP